MFFTRIGQVIGWLAVILGCVGLATGLLLANSSEEYVRQILGSRTTGQTIDTGVKYIVIGVAMGMLAEISRSVRAKAETVKRPD